MSTRCPFPGGRSRAPTQDYDLLFQTDQHTGLFPSTPPSLTLIMNIFTHTAKLKDLTNHLDSTINIFLYLCDHKLFIPHSYFLNVFQSEAQASIHSLLNISACISLTRAQYLFTFFLMRNLHTVKNINLTCTCPEATFHSAK